MRKAKKTTKTYRVAYEFELPGDLHQIQMQLVRNALAIAHQDLLRIVNGILSASGYKRRFYDPDSPKFRVWVKLYMDGERDGDFDNQGDLLTATIKSHGTVSRDS